MRVLIILVVALLALIAGLVVAITYVVFSSELNGDTKSLKSLLPTLSPLVLTLGVTIGFLTFWNHRKQHEHDSIFKESSFFFDECSRRYERVLAILSKPTSDMLDFGSGGVAIGAVGLEKVCFELKDISQLARFVSQPGFLSALKSREEDYVSDIVRTLHHLSIVNLSGWHWGGNGLAEKLENYNRHVDEKRNKISSATEADEFDNDYLQRQEDTPFPNGVSPNVLDQIIKILKSRVGRSSSNFEVSTVIRSFDINEPNSFIEYKKLCRSIENRNGNLLWGID